MKKHFTILHEDEAIVVIDKKAHVLSIPDRFDPTLPNLKEVLSRRRDEVFVVHRLDKETSGVIVFAKTAEAHAALSDQWQQGIVEKKYLALTLRPQEAAGHIDEGITESSHQKGSYIVSEDGKASQTSYQTLESWDRYALLELNLHTGRTHQIRVHMKYIGAPLLVDEKYGLSDAFYLSSIKKMKIPRGQKENPLLSRSALHAFQIKFNHPLSGDPVTYEAPLHKDMKAVMYQLKKKYDV